MSTISSGQVLSGGTVSSAVTVLSGGSVVSATVLNGGSVTVSSGGLVAADTVSGGNTTVLAGGVASGITDSSGFLTIIGGTATATTVTFGGEFSVVSGGYAAGTVVSSIGDYDVGSGGTASGTIFGGGLATVEGVDSASTVNAGFYEVRSGGQAISTLLTLGALPTVLSGGTLVLPTVESGVTVTVSAGGQISGAVLQPGAAVNYATIRFVSGEIVSFDAASDLLTVTAGGSTLASLQLAGSYGGDVFTVNAEPSGPTAGSTVVFITSAPPPPTSSGTTSVTTPPPASSGTTSVTTPPSSGTTGVTTPPPTSSGSGGSSGPTTYTNRVNLANGGSVTVTTPGTAFGNSTTGPGGFPYLTISAGGATVAGSLTTATLAGPGIVTLLPVSGGLAVPVATTSPLQTALLQDILALGQTVSEQAIYLPIQGSITSASTISSQVVLDLPERHDSISGTAAVPTADLVLDNPGGTYTTGATAASVVVTADGASTTVINNGSAGALIAATGAANNTLEGLAGANQFVTGIGGQDAVLLDGVANNLTTNGADAVLVGGPSTVTAAASGLDLIALTSSATLLFANLTAGPAVDSINGAAGATVIVAGSGNTSVNAGAGTEGFVVDTSAGNTTLNGAPGGGDTFLFVRDVSPAAASVTVNNFSTNDTLAVHGYAAFNVTAGASGAVLSLSDGSQVTFTGVGVSTIQQAVKTV